MSNQIYDYEINSTKQINGFPANAYQTLLVAAFAAEHPVNPNEPVLGVTDEVELSPDLTTFLNDESLIIESLEENGELIGCSIAVPIEKYSPERSDEAGETAYIYFTAIRPDHQGRGLVWPLNKTMDRKLIDAGYKYVERDSDIESGYADNVEKNYKMALVEKKDHEGFSDTGPERFFRIELGRLALEGRK